MCKALTEMLADERQEGIEQTLYSLVKKGHISEEQAAEELGISIEEFQLVFAAITDKK